MAPALIRQAVFVHSEKGSPAWGEGLALRVHVRFVGQLVALARVTAETGGDDVIPSRPPAFVAGRDMVEVELGFG